MADTRFKPNTDKTPTFNKIQIKYQLLFGDVEYQITGSFNLSPFGKVYLTEPFILPSGKSYDRRYIENKYDVVKLTFEEPETKENVNLKDIRPNLLGKTLCGFIQPPSSQSGEENLCVDIDENILEKILTCPISQKLIENPVVAKNGITYDRSSLVKYLEENESFLPDSLGHKSKTEDKYDYSSSGGYTNFIAKNVLQCFRSKKEAAIAEPEKSTSILTESSVSSVGIYSETRERKNNFDRNKLKFMYEKENDTVVFDYTEAGVTKEDLQFMYSQMLDLSPNIVNFIHLDQEKNRIAFSSTETIGKKSNASSSSCNGFYVAKAGEVALTFSSESEKNACLNRLFFLKSKEFFGFNSKNVERIKTFYFHQDIFQINKNEKLSSSFSSAKSM